MELIVHWKSEAEDSGQPMIKRGFPLTSVKLSPALPLWPMAAFAILQKCALWLFCQNTSESCLHYLVYYFLALSNTLFTCL